MGAFNNNNYYNSHYDTDKYSPVPIFFGQKAAGSYKYHTTKTTGGGPNVPRVKKVTKKIGYYFNKNEKDPAVLRQEAFEKNFADVAAKTQADIAKQLKIVQNEKSAVSKMMNDYSAQLKEEAKKREERAEAARVSAATSAANQARQNQTGNLQIQPASQTPTTTGGTRAFKRTGISPAGAFTTGISGMVNI